MKPSGIVGAILSFCPDVKTKKILATVIAVSTSVCSYGQGTVVFANSAASRVWIDAVPANASSIPVNDPRAVEAGTRYSVELMWAPGDTPDAAFDLLARRQGNATSVGGPFGQRGIFSGGNRTIQEIPGGSQAKFQVRVWETVAGSSYADALRSGGLYRTGASGILLVTTGNPTVTPAVPPAPLTGAGLTHFAVWIPGIPEPSVVGLSLLGVGALLMLRYRE